MADEKVALHAVASGAAAAKQIEVPIRNSFVPGDY